MFPEVKKETSDSKWVSMVFDLTFWLTIPISSDLRGALW